MTRTQIVGVLLACAACARCAQPGARTRIETAYGELSLSFEPNRGQADRQVEFLSRGSGYGVYLIGRGAVLMHGSETLQMTLTGASPTARAGGSKELPGTSNYLVGSDPAKWHTGIPNFAEVRYEGLYPGIDLVYYGNRRELEYDFVMHPGAQPGAIRIAFDRAMRIEASGDLVMDAPTGEIRFRRPIAYQEVAGVRREVRCRYTLKRGREAAFELGAYDPGQRLVIDPVLSYSTYLGGSSSDSATAIAVDRWGNAYVAGTTGSTDFPATPGVRQPAIGPGRCFAYHNTIGVPCSDAFVAKLNPEGTALLYSTYLGGKAGDSASAIAVDDLGNAYVLGSTSSLDFPLVNPLYSTGVGQFLAKLNGNGSALIYSTLLGPASATALAVDRSGDVYLTGGAGPGLPNVTPLQAGPRQGAAIFRSSDLGSTWQPAAAGLPQDQLNALTIAPDSSAMYAGMPEGVFKTTDGGATWTALKSAPPCVYGCAVAIRAPYPATLYLRTFGASDATAGGLFKSEDGGQTWRNIGAGLGQRPVASVALDPGSRTTLYAGTSDGLFKSTDDGNTWSPTGFIRTGPVNDTSKYVNTVAVDPQSTAILYLGTSDAAYASTDGGATFQAIESGITGDRGTRVVVIDPFNPATLFRATSDAVYKSTDRGQTWRNTRADTQAYALALDPRVPNRLYAATSNGFLMSGDGAQTWQDAGRDLPGAIGAAAVDPATSAVYAGLVTLPGGDAFVAKLNTAGSAFVYSAYLGGSGADSGTGIAVDSTGRAYIAGVTSSPDLPLANAIQRRKGGGRDAFVSVLAPDGGSLVFSTYLGGAGDDSANAIALDSSGGIYIAGYTRSTDLPTMSPLQRGSGSISTGDAFVAKLDLHAARLVYSTYLGGTRDDNAAGIAVDSGGNAYVAGITWSADFPTASPLQSCGTTLLWSAFIAKLNAAGSALSYSTCLSGSYGEQATGIAVGGDGDAYIVGTTYSSDFPVRNPLQGQLRGGTDAFVARITEKTQPSGVALNAVVNSASYSSAALAPGAIVTLFGNGLAEGIAFAPSTPIPAVLLGTKVTFNGVAAPLFFVSPGQINAQLPFESSPGAALVEVTTSAGSGRLPVTIGNAGPGIFTMNMEGTGPGAILHAEGLGPVSEAAQARPGEFLAIYCTGLGGLEQAVVSGAVPPSPPPATIGKPEVLIAGLTARVVYSGLAPGFAGLYQVNVQVPADVPSGQQPLTITLSGVSSNSVTITVR